MANDGLKKVFIAGPEGLETPIAIPLTDKMRAEHVEIGVIMEQGPRYPALLPPHAHIIDVMNMLLHFETLREFLGNPDMEKCILILHRPGQKGVLLEGKDILSPIEPGMVFRIWPKDKIK